MQPRNTKVFSNFAETRTYVYAGKPVDTQVHVGFDLASTKQSPVPAANAGLVAFAGPLTIYGNAVILDHGLGLQTLYAHLSTIDVKAGRHGHQGPGARPQRHAPAWPSAITCTSRCSSPACR